MTFCARVFIFHYLTCSYIAWRQRRGYETKTFLFSVNLGKTNLMQRFTKNTFNPESRSTIGVDFSSKTVPIGEHHVKAQVWDTAYVLGLCL